MYNTYNVIRCDCMLSHCSVSRDRMFEEAYEETTKAKAGEKNITKQYAAQSAFQEKLENLKLFRDLYYKALVREMDRIDTLGARCDRSRYISRCNQIIKQTYASRVIFCFTAKWMYRNILQHFLFWRTTFEGNAMNYYSLYVPPLTHIYFELVVINSKEPGSALSHYHRHILDIKFKKMIEAQPDYFRWKM